MNRNQILFVALAIVLFALPAIAQSHTRRTLGPSGQTPTVQPAATQEVEAPAGAQPSPRQWDIGGVRPASSFVAQQEISVKTLKPQAAPVIPALNQKHPGVVVAPKSTPALDENPTYPTPKIDGTAKLAPPVKFVEPAKETGNGDRNIAAVEATPIATADAETPYSKEVARLQAIAPAPIPLRNVPLGTVIRAIAMHSSMNYIAPNEDEFGELVTLRYSGSPWQLLSILKRRHNFEMTFEDGIWSFFRTNPSELISRTYHLRYNNNVNVKSSGNSTAASANNVNNNAGSGSGGTATQQATTGGRGNIFESSGDQVVKDLKTLLGIPVTGLDATIANGLIVGENSPIASATKASSIGKIEAAKSDVIYLPNDNSLFVIATRQQHQYVEEFLKAADRPQPLIRIDAKLVETNRDPRSFIGIDPSGFARPTISLKSASGAAVTEKTSASGGAGLSTPEFDLGNLRTLRAPNAAVLSTDDIKFQLNLLKQDSTSRVTNQPNLVTTNNREVSIESVIEEPYASSQTNNSFSGSAGTNGQTTTQLDRIKIGTVINVLPQIMRGENGQRLVYLNLEMTISGKVGDKLVFGQLVPITSSRSYRYSIAVPDGYTLAIGGLDETSISEAQNKVPIAGDIPLVGYIFKSKTAANTRRNLIAYITPTILGFPGEKDLAKSSYQPIPIDSDAIGKSKHSPAK